MKLKSDMPEAVRRERDTMRVFARWWRRWGRKTDLAWAVCHRRAAERLAKTEALLKTN
jgi:hypothetical protein